MGTTSANHSARSSFDPIPAHRSDIGHYQKPASLCEQEGRAPERVMSEESCRRARQAVVRILTRRVALRFVKGDYTIHEGKGAAEMHTTSIMYDLASRALNQARPLPLRSGNAPFWTSEGPPLLLMRRLLVPADGSRNFSAISSTAISSCTMMRAQVGIIRAPPLGW